MSDHNFDILILIFFKINIIVNNTPIFVFRRITFVKIFLKWLMLSY